MSETALRGAALQVCLPCVRERGHCLAAWELAGCCACPRHGVYLVDRCPRCQKQLSWNRPALDICRCGRYLTPVGDGLVAPIAILDWCKWLEDCCLSQPAQAPVWVLPLWLRHVDPDAAFHVLMAFGCSRNAARRSDRSRGAPRQLRPRDMGACLEAAFEGIASVDVDGHLMPRELAKVIDDQLLVRLARFGTSEAGRRTAWQLLRRMHHEQSTTHLLRHWRGGRRAKGQMELFDDGFSSTE